jgi:acetyl-CoA carboxylase biotin carboxyl carrier protein
MQLDHDQLNALLAALVESDIQEFRLEGDDFRLEVRRNLPVTTVAAPLAPVAPAPVAPPPENLAVEFLLEPRLLQLDLAQICWK